MVGVGRLELPTSASQMPRAADCAIPQNMSTQFFYLAGASKPHDYTWSNYHIANDFFATTHYTAGLAVDSISLSSEERRPKLPES